MEKLQQQTKKKKRTWNNEKTIEGLKLEDNLLKKRLLKGLRKSLGIFTAACKYAKCSRSKLYKLIKEDRKFAKKVKEINEEAGDFVESKLFTAINECNITAIIFYCKNKLKSRGYNEDIYSTTKIDKQINITKLDIID